MEVFNRISTYAIQARERLPMEATQMLIAGALDFVVFVRKHNDYAPGGSLSRYVESIREVVGHDGRVLSGEVFAPGRTAAPPRTRRSPAWTSSSTTATSRSCTDRGRDEAG